MELYKNFFFFNSKIYLNFQRKNFECFIFTFLLNFFQKLQKKLDLDEKAYNYLCAFINYLYVLLVLS